jgi:hypothetical protein
MLQVMMVAWLSGSNIVQHSLLIMIFIIVMSVEVVVDSRI